MLRSPVRVVVSVLILVAAVGLRPASIEAAGDDIRATWVSRTEIESPDAVRRAVSTALTNGFNTIVVPASIFPSGLASFDGLAEAVTLAHARGLRVHAAVDVNRVASSEEVPGLKTHVLYEQPEWLMVPRDLAPEMLALDVRSPDYVGRLARWTRANAGRVTGIYVSPLYPEAAAHIAASVRQLVEQYMVDGIELNEAQYPGGDFDYSRLAMERFRADLRPRLAAAEQRRMDGIEAIDPFAYADEHPEEWRRFRQASLTALVTRVRTAVKAVRPQIVISAGVAGDETAALRDHLQDWRTWIDNGFVDAISRRTGSKGSIATIDHALDVARPVSALRLDSPSATH